ncbi:MAG: GNAT family N-acetyltransferase [Ktedonobacterales bacterium]
MSNTNDENATPAALAAIFGAQRTARLALRRPQADDVAAMFAIHGDPATYRHKPSSVSPSLRDSEETLRVWMRQWEAEGFGYWAVTLPDSDDVIGFGGVRRMAWRNRDMANLYYRFTPRAWGHGYAPETARHAVTLARAHLPQWPVIARVDAINLASQRTAERAGLLRRPDLDDEEYLIYALGWEA